MRWERNKICDGIYGKALAIWVKGMMERQGREWRDKQGMERQAGSGETRQGMERQGSVSYRDGALRIIAIPQTAVDLEGRESE